MAAAAWLERRLFVNGTILTMHPGAPVAEALAVRDGRITAVGATAAAIQNVP